MPKLFTHMNCVRPVNRFFKKRQTLVKIIPASNSPEARP